MARKNILNSGKYATSTLVRVRAYFLKFTEDLPEYAREPYKKAICSLFVSPLLIPATGPFMKKIKTHIATPRAALAHGFKWIETEEGETYWLTVYKSLS